MMMWLCLSERGLQCLCSGNSKENLLHRSLAFTFPSPTALRLRWSIPFIWRIKESHAGGRFCVHGWLFHMGRVSGHNSSAVFVISICGEGHCALSDSQNRSRRVASYFSRCVIYTYNHSRASGILLYLLPIAWNSYTDEMIGDHCAVLIADAYQKVPALISVLWFLW